MYTGTGSGAFLRHDYLSYYFSTVTCPDLTLTNGMISYSPSIKLEGTVATHSCDAGYGLSGGSMRTCQSERTWSGGEIICIGTIDDK